jgi:hypothetical protein
VDRRALDAIRPRVEADRALAYCLDVFPLRLRFGIKEDGTIFRLPKRSNWGGTGV